MAPGEATKGTLTERITDETRATEGQAGRQHTANSSRSSGSAREELSEDSATTATRPRKADEPALVIEEGSLGRRRTMKTRGNTAKERSLEEASTKAGVSFDATTSTAKSAAANAAAEAARDSQPQMLLASYLGKPIALPLVTPLVAPQEHPVELPPSPPSVPHPAHDPNEHDSDDENGKYSKSPKRRGVPHIYHDYSKVPDTLGYARKKTGGVTQPFPEKLMEMLAKETDVQHIVGWLPHGRAFIVRKPKAFTEEIMHKHFRQTKLTSFQRQLNLYGFRRLTQGPDAGAYYHEMFLRGRPQLCLRMHRQKVKGTGHKQPADAQSEPNFYAMAHQPPSSPDSAMMEPESPGIQGLHGAAHALSGLAMGSIGLGALQGTSPGSTRPTASTSMCQQLHTSWGATTSTASDERSAAASSSKPAAFYWPPAVKTSRSSQPFETKAPATSTNIWSDANRRPPTTARASNLWAQAGGTVFDHGDDSSGSEAEGKKATPI